MSVNLVSVIMQSLSSERIENIASALGLEKNVAQRGANVAVPAMLAGLANVASTPEGAQKLSSAVSRIGSETTGLQTGMPDSRPLGSADSGWSTISSLMGNSSLETISSVIAQFSGFGQGSAKKLLGVIAPFIFSALRREQVTSGLDPKGLATLLAGQRSNIEQAMPAGVLSRFQDAQIRDVPRPQPAASTRTRTEDTSGSSRQWAYWVLPAIVLAGLAAYFLPRNTGTETAQDTRQAARPETTVARQTPREVQPTTVAAVTPASLENDIMSNVTRLRTALQGIKDTASAQAALPELREISNHLARLNGLAQQLPAETRKTVAQAVSSKVPDLNTMFERVTEISANNEAKPAIDTLRSHLNGLTKA
jgi:hypothetical protein